MCLYLKNSQFLSWPLSKSLNLPLSKLLLIINFSLKTKNFYLGENVKLLIKLIIIKFNKLSFMRTEWIESCKYAGNWFADKVNQRKAVQLPVVCFFVGSSAVVANFMWPCNNKGVNSESNRRDKRWAHSQTNNVLLWSNAAEKGKEYKRKWILKMEGQIDILIRHCFASLPHRRLLKGATDRVDRCWRKCTVSDYCRTKHWSKGDFLSVTVIKAI